MLYCRSVNNISSLQVPGVFAEVEGGLSAIKKIIIILIKDLSSFLVLITDKPCCISKTGKELINIILFSVNGVY